MRIEVLQDYDYDSPNALYLIFYVGPTAQALTHKSFTSGQLTKSKFSWITTFICEESCLSKLSSSFHLWRWPAEGERGSVALWAGPGRGSRVQCAGQGERGPGEPSCVIHQGLESYSQQLGRASPQSPSPDIDSPARASREWGAVSRAG